MRFLSLVIALVALCASGLSSVRALDAGMLDRLVERLETMMEAKDISAEAMSRALAEYGTKQSDPAKIELVAALEAHFADSEARVAWLKKHALTVKTVPAPEDKNAEAASEQDDRIAPVDCAAGTHEGSSWKCEKDVRSCRIDHGTGETRWDVDALRWGDCRVASCEDGYAASADERSCESQSVRFPGCDEDDRLIGDLFWSMCDSTGSYYLNYYFSALDGDNACPSDYRLPTAAEWRDAYAVTRGTESDSDENRWKYSRKLASDLQLSARGQLHLNSGYALIPNNFSLEAPATAEIDYGDVPKEERSDRNVLTPDRSYGDYRYLASDGIFGLYGRYDTALGEALVQFYSGAPAVDASEAGRYLMSVRCVRDEGKNE